MADDSARLPRIIWTLWLQGWDRAPKIAGACLDSWRRWNRDWEIRALTNADLETALDVAAAFPTVRNKALSFQAYSDVVRVGVLERFGGVWVDATVYCTKPLDSWLPERIGSGFFAFARPAPDRMLSSWFLAAESGSPLIATWKRLTVDYWAGRAAPHSYFWFHYLFAEAYETDAVCRRIWDATPKVPADGPHAFLPYDAKLLAPLDEAARRRVAGDHDPLYKLTHKLDEANAPPDSVLAHLLAPA